MSIEYLALGQQDNRLVESSHRFIAAGETEGFHEESSGRF